MKITFYNAITAGILLFMPAYANAQAPNLGTAANFVFFTMVGEMTNTGISHVTGNVGSNSGSSTGFGNVDGQMHDGGPASAQASADLLLAYNELNTAIPDYTISSTMGNGDVLVPGVYLITEAATLNLILKLNGGGDPNAVFVFKIQGSFSTNALSEVRLQNGTKACNVFWKVEGLVSMATGTKMKGTVVANNAAISMAAGCTLEGRLLSTSGAVTMNGALAYTPVGCGSPVLLGPAAPDMGEAECYALFSSSGAVTNSGVSHITGDVGSNNGGASGFITNDVTGTIHETPDPSTAQCAADLGNAYTYLNNLPYDINLLYPAQFGNNLVLTPHTYLLDAATVLTDTLILNAGGRANAVFVFQLNGALSTSTYAFVKLINGAQAKNVYWKIEGAVGINNYSTFVGTIVCHDGALGALNTGVTLDGRALSTTGAVTSTAITAAIPTVCTTVGISTPNETGVVTIHPNPFSATTTITLSDASQVAGTELRMYNLMGAEVMRVPLSNQSTTIDMAHLALGVYYYNLVNNEQTIQSGKLISQ